MAFFPQEQIRIIANGLQEELKGYSQKERSDYIDAVWIFLSTYGPDGDKQHQLHKLLMSLEYMPDSDLPGKQGLISYLADSYLAFKKQQTDQDKNSFLEEKLNLFLEEKYTLNLLPSKKISEAYLHRIEVNFEAAYLNHSSNPKRLPNFLREILKTTIMDYIKSRRLSIIELDVYIEHYEDYLNQASNMSLDTYTKKFTEHAVTILTQIANKYSNAVALAFYTHLEPNISKKSNSNSQSVVQQMSQFKEQNELTHETLAELFKKTLHTYLDNNVLSRIRKSTVLPGENLQTSLLYDTQMWQLLQFLLPNPPNDTKICYPFSLSNEKAAHAAAANSLKTAFYGLPNNGIVHLPLFLNGHWAHFKVTITRLDGKLQPHIHYTDSGTCRDWALPALEKLLREHLIDALGDDFIISRQSIGTREQDDGYTCGDRTIWRICEDILGKDNPWTFMGSQKRDDPASIRNVTKSMLEALKDPDKPKPANWKALFSNQLPTKEQNSERKNLINQTINKTGRIPSFFDDQRLLLLLFFLFLLFCGSVIGLAISTFFGSHVIINFFTGLFPQYDPISTAVCSLLLGLMGGLVTLYIINQGLKNATADIKVFLHDAGEGILNLMNSPANTLSATPDNPPPALKETNVNGNGKNVVTSNHPQKKSVLSQNVNPPGSTSNSDEAPKEEKTNSPEKL